MLLKFSLLFSLILQVCIGLNFQCRDQENQNVDWFIFYKIGHIKKSTAKSVRNGFAFLYMDANHQEWSLSAVEISNLKQAIGYTLQQYYDSTNNSEVFNIMYNDEFPYPNNDTLSGTSGHTKGVLVFGKSDGFWLIHSVPKFPRNDTYEYPITGRHYGQMGLCVSMSYSQLHKIAIQLYYNHLFIYSQKLPAQMADDIPILAKVVSKEYQRAAPYVSRAVIYSSAGHEFVHFAKTRAFNKDLYFDLVAPALESSLKTETWQHETSRNRNLHSWCRKYSSFKVLDVKKVILPFNITFPNAFDHSKFAVATLDAHKVLMPWICIGDINRQESQLLRAGGTMCFANSQVHSIYNAMVPDYWPCINTGS
ncbi:deoxyribonuclease II family protein [Loa loa]|nr:deoxyribonuclease II family protein [Loa loa]EFO20585.1 deoxyribonuclease II family protein [Loa loa]